MRYPNQSRCKQLIPRSRWTKPVEIGQGSGGLDRDIVDLWIGAMGAAPGFLLGA
jgi:hypothetical protein